MSDKAERIALVTGANRGIGFEVCRQLATKGFIVLLTARDANKARAAADALRSIGRVESLVLDVADANSIVMAGLLLRALRESYGQQVCPIAGLAAVSSRMASPYRGDNMF